MGVVVGVMVTSFLLILVFMLVQDSKQMNMTSQQKSPLHEVKKVNKDYRLAITAALQQMLTGASENAATGDRLLLTDGMLHSYHDADVDWRSLWGAAAQRSLGVPPFGALPYWTPSGPGRAPVPCSILAFWGSAARLRTAENPETDRIVLAMLAGDRDLTGRPNPRLGDPEPMIQEAAARRL